MKKIKNDYLLKLVILLFIGVFAVSIGWASPIRYPETVLFWIATNDVNPKPKFFGKEILIPIKVDTPFRMESAIFEFEVQPPKEEGVSVKSVQIKPVSFQQSFLIAYIPVVITGEGHFEVKGKLTVKFIDENNVSKYFTNLIWSKSFRLVFFAFNGKYIDGSFERMARYQLSQQNNEASRLLAKVEEGALIRQDLLSSKEHMDLHMFIYEEKIKLQQQYLAKYPSIKKVETENSK